MRIMHGFLIQRGKKSGPYPISDIEYNDPISDIEYKLKEIALWVQAREKSNAHWVHAKTNHTLDTSLHMIAVRVYT